jgi:hypothetical protein
LKSAKSRPTEARSAGVKNVEAGAAQEVDVARGLHPVGREPNEPGPGRQERDDPGRAEVEPERAAVALDLDLARVEGRQRLGQLGRLLEAREAGKVRLEPVAELVPAAQLDELAEREADAAAVEEPVVEARVAFEIDVGGRGGEPVADALDLGQGGGNEDCEREEE